MPLLGEVLFETIFAIHKPFEMQSEVFDAK